MAITLEGKTLYAIAVQRTCYVTLYTFAENEQDAKEDAEELVADLRLNDWTDIDDDIDVMPAEKAPRPGTTVWSGGPDGEDISWPDEAASA